MHGATPAALVAAVLLALGSSCAATPTPAAPYEASERPDHRLSLLFGGRFLDEDGLDDLGVGGLQEQPGFGLELSTCPPTWPIGFELGVAGAVDEDEDDVTGVDVEGRLAEIYAGLRKNFETGTAVVPYVGGGFSFIQAEIDIDTSPSVDDDDSSPGLYLHAGLLFDLSRLIHLGLDVRTLQGTDIEVFSLDGDVDYWQFAFVFGFGF